MISLLGASIAGPGDINLLPQEIKAQRIEFLERASLRIIGITLGAIFLFSLFILKFQEHDYNKRLKNAEAHLETIKEIKEFRERIVVRQSLIDKICKNKVPTYGLLKQVSNLLPSSVILNELFLDNEQNYLILKGVVLSSGEIAEDILTDFMKKAEETSFFSETDLLFSKNTGGVQGFEIRLTLEHL